jgi:hypothetical protein
MDHYYRANAEQPFLVRPERRPVLRELKEPAEIISGGEVSCQKLKTDLRVFRELSFEKAGSPDLQSGSAIFPGD